MAKNLNRKSLGTPKGVPDPAPPATPENKTINDVLAESKEAIAKSDKKDVSRGRPRKDGTPAQAKDHANKTALNTPGAPVSAQLAQQMDLAKYLAPPLAMVSQIPARKLGCDDLALNKDEAKLLADSLDAAITAYFPDVEKMSPKAAASLGLALTASSLFLAKAQIYAKFKESQPPVVNPENTPEVAQNNNSPQDGAISAMEHFRHPGRV